MKTRDQLIREQFELDNMNNEEETMTIQERAREAARKAAEAQAQYEAEERQRNVEIRNAALAEALGQLGIEKDGVLIADGEAWIDGLRFTSNTRKKYRELYLWGTCPHCGEQVPSKGICNLVDLARMLDRFEPDDPDHLEKTCRWPLDEEGFRVNPNRNQTPPTLAERLVEVLTELIRAEMGKE